MKKTTRKSFSRKAIVAVMSVFLTVSLTAVGFASWLISNDDSKEGTGNVTASDVSDAILDVTINNAENLGKINFGPDKGDETGTIRYNKAEADDFEALEITVSGSIDKYKTLDKMSITVQCPDSILTAAGYTWNAEGERTYAYDKKKAYIALPTCAVDTNGKVLPLPDGTGNTAPLDFENGNALFKGTDENKKTFETKISFGWGALFEGKNPGRYLDGEDGTLSEENKNALLAIINEGKDETSQYKKIDAKGDAEAKRDILTAMKKAIAVSEAKFTVVVNAQAK